MLAWRAGFVYIFAKAKTTAGEFFAKTTRDMTIHEQQIKDIVDRETKAWDTQDIELLMTIFHRDMVWPWPPNAQAHDPMEWIFWCGRYDEQRWTRNWRELFDTHTLVHNRRVIR